MKLTVEKGDLAKFRCDLLVVNEFEGVKRPGGATGAVDKALGGWITDAVSGEEFSGKAGSTLLLHSHGEIPATRVLVVGLGKQDKFDLEVVRKAAGTAISVAKKLKAKRVGTLLHGAGIGGLKPADAAEALAVGSLLADYDYTGYFSKPDEDRSHKILSLTVVEHEAKKIPDIQSGLEVGTIIAQATNQARDLINTPSNRMTPEDLAARARAIGKEISAVKVMILGPKDIKEKGMGAYWSVAQGSKQEPRLLVLRYDGGGRETYGFVGKGITFDSGGISLKPSKKMSDMKYDMSGGAAAMEAVWAAAKMKLKKRVVAVIPATENMPGGGASKPGDVVTTLSGKSVEIINTDAEGRLVLSDGLAYAKKLGATRLVDIATLTGACVVSLGDHAFAILGNNDKFIDAVRQASTKAGERCWQLPLYDEYRDYLKSDVADIANCTEHGKAGTSVGAVFLKEFVGDTQWVHLDIAGTAWNEGGSGYLGKGATGSAVRTLIELLRGRD